MLRLWYCSTVVLVVPEYLLLTAAARDCSSLSLSLSFIVIFSFFWTLSVQRGDHDIHRFIFDSLILSSHEWNEDWILRINVKNLFKLQPDWCWCLSLRSVLIKCCWNMFCNKSLIKLFTYIVSYCVFLRGVDCILSHHQYICVFVYFWVLSFIKNKQCSVLVDLVTSQSPQSELLRQKVRETQLTSENIRPQNTDVFN